MTKKKFVVVLAVSVLAAGAIACDKKAKASDATGKTVTASAAAATGVEQPAAPHQIAPGVEMVPITGTIIGTVIEAHDARSFTYVKIKTDKAERWAAVDRTPLKAGQPITVIAKMAALKFESAHLDRTFENLVFGTVEGAGPTKGLDTSWMRASVPQEGHDEESASPHGASMSMSKPQRKPLPPIENIAKAEGSEGRTVADVWALRAQLDQKQVAVRGVVVKYTHDVLGKNWMHIQDGTGSKKEGSNDLLVLTTDQSSVGAKVLVRGTIRRDLDMGTGPQPVLLENATVKNESF